MEEAQAFGLLPEEPIEATPLDVGFWPTAIDEPPVVVPRNVEEVASQLAMALDDEDGNFAERYTKHLSDLRSGGMSPPLARVLDRELDDNIAAGEAQTYAYARLADVEGATLAAKATRTLHDSRPTNTPEKRPVEAQVALATRALESQGIPKGATVESYMRRLDPAAHMLATRNMLEAIVAKHEKEATFLDSLKDFGGEIIPTNRFSTIGAIERFTGKSYGMDVYAAVNDLRGLLRQLEPAQMQHVVTSVLTDLSSNPAARAGLARKLLSFTLAEARVADVLDATILFDVGAVAKGLLGLARKGIPAAVVRDAAGEKKSAELVTTDLLNKTKLSGLNESEQIARALAAGVSPLEADPARVVGLAAPMQVRLRESWDTLLTNVKERLNSSSVSADEVAVGKTQLRESAMRDTDNTIYHVEYGEASADGLKMVVFRQGRDGTTLLSREAAEAEALARGLQPGSYTVVPKNAVGDTSLRGRAADDFEVAEEIASIQVDDVPELKRLLKQAEKDVAFYRKQKGAEVAIEMSEALSVKRRIEELLEVAPRLSTEDDVVEFRDLTNAVKQRMGMPSEAPAPAPTVVVNEAAAAFAKATGLSKAQDTTGARILDVLSKGSKDPSYTHLAKRLLDNKSIDWSKVRVHVQDELPNGFAGAYAPKADVALVRTDRLNSPNIEEIALHEVLHAHSAQIIAAVQKDAQGALAAGVATGRQIKAVRELEALQKALNANLDKLSRKLDPKTFVILRDALLGVSYPDELLTYGLTDPAMRKLFSSIKLTDIGLADGGSVMSKLWDSFKKILGFDGNDTVLAKVYSVFDNIDSGVTEATRTVLSRAEPRILGMADKPRIELKSSPEQLSPATEWLVREERVDPLSYAAIGKFTQKDIDSMATIAFDPKHAASEQGLEARVVGVHAEAKTKKELEGYIESFYKGLSRAQVQKVHAVLKEGDAFSNAGSVGREFTYTEVAARGLNDDEALAYLATRQLRMAMYHLRNGEMVRHLRAQGLKEVEFAGSGVKAAGRVLDVDGAKVHANTYLYDATTKDTAALRADELDAAYASGKHIVRLDSPTMIDGQLRQLMLVDNATASVKDITTALHYRPGEFSRIYTDEYFIRTKRLVKVDGVEQVVENTVRTARSAREAEAFTVAVKKAVDVLKNGTGNVDRQLNELLSPYFDVEEFKAGFKDNFEGLTTLDFHYTRNKEEYLNGSISEAVANGRLFTSKRSDRLMSVDRARENTLGVFESLEAEITNISRVTNISQWRETMVRRWMNTFADLLPNKTGNDVADFYAAAGSKFTKGTQESLFAERTHAYIMRQIGLQTTEERTYQHLTRRMSEQWFKGGEGIESVGAKLRQGTGVLGFIRNINFNLTLGMFNPAQLLVQANGAATALILSPLHGLAAAKTFPLLRMALMSDKEGVWRSLAKFDIGGDSDDFVSLVKAVRQTGILSNIRSTALYNLEEGATNVFGSYPRKLLGSHTFFFNRGEEFARTVSFDVARREWRAANGGADWTTKEALKDIVVRMDDLTQNMTKANLARFQEGAVSIPLQFAQYNIKLFMNVMSSLLGKGEGRGFTKTEAVRLMAGHVLLYGAAGNGLSWMVDELLDTKTKDSMSVEAKTYLGQGLLAGLVSQVGEALTGERTNVALGTRLGAFDYYQKLAEAVFTDPKNVYEALMGPTVSTAKRIGVIGEVAALWKADPDISGKDVLYGLMKMSSEQVSSLRNAAKAYVFLQHQSKMLDKNGFPVAQLTPMEVMGQALGFQPTAAVDVHKLLGSKKAHDEAIGDIANTIFQVQKQIMDARNRGDHAYADEQHKLLVALWPVNTGDLMEVQRRIRDKLYPYDNKMQKLLADYLWKGHTYDQPLVVTQPPRKQ